VPVHTIALGDTTVRADLVVRGVDHNRIGYLGNDLPMVVRIEARKLAGARSRLSVLHEGRELVGTDLVIPSDRWFTEVPLMVRADKPGLQRYVVRIAALEGEEQEANNTAVIYIEVLDDRRSILLVGASPHPDMGAIRNALGGLEGYATTITYASDFKGELEGHDLLVLHQRPAMKYGAGSLLEEARRRRIPMLVILGTQSDRTALANAGLGVDVTQMRPAHPDAQAAVAPTVEPVTEPSAAMVVRLAKRSLAGWASAPPAMPIATASAISTSFRCKTSGRKFRLGVDMFGLRDDWKRRSSGSFNISSC
jgi:hypothetical protein